MILTHDEDQHWAVEPAGFPELQLGQRQPIRVGVVTRDLAVAVADNPDVGSGVTHLGQRGDSFLSVCGYWSRRIFSARVVAAQHQFGGTMLGEHLGQLLSRLHLRTEEIVYNLMISRQRVGRVAAATIGTALLSVLLTAGPSAVSAAAATTRSELKIDATANLWTAGYLQVPPQTDGTPPPSVPVVGGQVVNVSASGRVSCDNLYFGGPDGVGGCGIQSTSIAGSNGISGISASDKGMFLAGVFTDDSARSPISTGPSALDFSPAASLSCFPTADCAIGTEFDILNPALNQSFFIGDGVTSAGLQQQFVAPVGATRLFLGVTDAPFNNGSPGAYTGNAGAISATVALKDTLPTVVRSPDLKVVRFLQVPFSDCLNQLMGLWRFPDPRVLTANARATAGCTFLVGSSNPTPSNDISGWGWQDLVTSKEFRGFIDLPSYTIRCENGVITSLTSAGSSGVSPGWSPIVGPRQERLYDEKAEFYNGQDGIFHPSAPAVTYSNDHSAVRVSYREASRIATVARRGQMASLGYDAPFIWAALHERLSCNGNVDAVVAHSTIPRVAAYAGYRSVLETAQSPDLASFVGSGGVTYHQAGQGNLDPQCTAEQIVGAGVNTVLPDCQAGINDGSLPV